MSEVRQNALADQSVSGCLLDADQLAARWLVSKAQVYRLAREGRVPTIRIGRYFRFRLAAIEAWELENEASGG